VTELYKVSPPRAEMVFHPSRFWRTEDWESSTDRPREGYIEENVLYAGDFEEVSIHLFPRVRVVRVRPADADCNLLQSLGLNCHPGNDAYVFVEESRRAEVEGFKPTIFSFSASGFIRVRRGEYVSRQVQEALGAETIPISEALARWNVAACYVEGLDAVISKLTSAGVYFEEQR